MATAAPVFLSFLTGAFVRAPLNAEEAELVLLADSLMFVRENGGGEHKYNCSGKLDFIQKSDSLNRIDRQNR